MADRWREGLLLQEEAHLILGIIKSNFPSMNDFKFNKHHQQGENIAGTWEGWGVGGKT